MLAEQYLKEGNKPAAIRTFQRLGSLSRAENNFIKSIEYHNLGLSLALEIGDTDEVISAYNQIGTNYRRMGAYEQASNYHYRALQAYEQYKDKTTERAIKNRVISLNGIGIIYLMLDNLDAAHAKFLSALEGERQLGSHLGMAINYANIGAIFERRQMYDSARVYYNLSMENNRLANSNLGIALCHNHFGSLAKLSGDFEEALKEYYTAYNILAKTSDRWHLMETLLSIVRVNIAKGDLEAAVMYLDQAEVIAYELNSNDHLAVVYKLRYNYSEKTGNLRLALDSYIKSHHYSDSTLNLKNINHINNLRLRYEAEKQETKINVLEYEKKLISIFGISLLLLISVIFFFFWRWIAQKKRLAEQQVKQLEQEKQLVATQALLDGETQERMRVARDLHDGLGSLLAAVKLNLDQAAKSPEKTDSERFDKAIKMLDDSIGEMRRIAHHLMPDALFRFGLKTALTDFCNSISITEFNYFGDERRLTHKLEVAVYRIAHELISNSLKHSGASHILVQIVQETDRLALTVEDNGCGFDPETVTKSSMGLTNIRTRVAAVGGMLDIKTAEGKGTEVNVELKIL